MIDSGKAIRYGWESVKKDFVYLVGIAVVAIIISSLFDRPNNDRSIWSLVGWFLSVWMTCGYTKLFLSYQSGKKLPFSALFTQLKFFWRVLGASILVGLIVIAGLFLLIIPGIYLALRFQFTITLIIDKDLGIMEAMRESSRLTNGMKLQLLSFDLITLGVIILGVLALGVGVFVAIPVTWLAGVVVYRQLSTGQKTAPKPATA